MNTGLDTDALRLREDEAERTEQDEAWHILVVDDDEDIHNVTRLVLRDARVLDAPLRLSHARTGAEAIQQLRPGHDVAAILLDVVMETDDAGLRVADHVRKTLKDASTRIIFRTGQPGAVDEDTAAIEYGGDYYETKSTLTVKRLLATLHMALSAYSDRRDLRITNHNLRRALEEKELFTNAIAHDIKGPVREIANFCDLLNLDRPTLTDKQLNEYIGFIGDASRRLCRTLDELVKLARLGSDSLVLRELSLHELTETALRDMRSTLEGQRASLSNDSSGTVTADEDKLLLALNHILENAVKYRSPERALQITITSQEQGESVILSIADNGIGVSEMTRESIFLPFRRGVGGDQYPGIGIGLAASKKLIEAHGGSIWVDSRLGEGSTFHIKLPKIKAE